MEGRGPAGSRRRLGAELRRLRGNSGLHLDEVAARVPCSTSKVSRLETGKGSPKLADVQRLMEIYGVTSDTESEMLLRLVRDSRGHGWWEPYTDGVTPERFVMESPARYPALESEASAVRAFEVATFHGLLQAPPYARAVLTALLPEHDEVEIAQLVELRRARQARLTARESPLELVTVVDESVLHRVVGSPAVMAAQLEHVLELARRPNVTVRVLPFRAGFHRAHSGPFIVLEFPAGAGADVVFVESHAGQSALENRSDVDLYKDLLADAARHALPPDLSRDVMGRWAGIHRTTKGSPP